MKKPDPLLRVIEEWTGHKRPVRHSIKLSLVLIGIIALALASCSGTTFYHSNGKPSARFQGDMTKMRYRQTADGAIDWQGDVSHSAATRAQGEAGAGKLSAAGAAVAASGIMGLFR